MDFNPGIFLEHLQKDLDCCTSTDDVTHFRVHSLRESILKKFVTSTQNASFHDEAIRDFLARNEESATFSLDPSFESSSVFRTWKTLIHDVFHSGPLQMPSITLDRCVDLGYCGPGASIGTETTAFVEKMFTSSLTCTDKSLVTYYRHRIAGTRWEQAEVTRQTLYGSTIVAGSKLSSVPKDCTKNRTICIEPTLNMFYQLGAKQQIESVLRKRLSIDIAKQADINKALARTASINGELSTIDLKNASDSITVELVRKLLPPDIFNTLDVIRSEEADDGDGNFHRLSMFSTMGNGFTFPLMTTLFATLIKAISIHAGISSVNGVDYGVFGDDLIVRSSITDTLVDCLKQAGFTVNTLKSFTTGPFRESCGGDFYNGHDVRGVYIKGVNDAGQVYSAFNRLHFWSLRNNVSLHNCLLYLKGLVDFRPVPGHAGLHEGFIVTRDQLTSPKTDRNGAIFYRSTEYVSRGYGVRRFAVNPDGCIIAAIGGFIANNRVLCRVKGDTVPSVVKKKTPCWDFLQHPGVNRRDLSLSWLMLLSTN